jgi:mannose-6-phosphate isomerase-like protein (cupin superfamily)
MKLIAMVLLAAGFALSAGDPQGFYAWKSAELKAFTTSLASKLEGKNVVTQDLATHGNCRFMVAHRDSSGEAEYHAQDAGIFVVQSGTATLVYGGELVDGKTTAPNEMRAASIKGGMEKALAAGDSVTIPAKLPHQVRLAPGKEFTFRRESDAVNRA